MSKYTNILTLIILLLSGCSTPTPAPTLTVTLAPTATLAPTQTPTLSPTNTPAPTSTPTPPPTDTPAPTLVPTVPPTVVVTPVSVNVESIAFTTEDGVELAGTLFLAEGDTAVVLAHMGAQDQQSWRPFAKLIASRGFTTLTFDFRCYGLSDCNAGAGGDTSARDVRTAIGLLRTRGFDRIVCMGGSFGGDACMNAALEEELAGLVVIASPRPGHWQKQYPQDLVSPTMPKLFIVTERDYTQVANAMSLLYEVSPEPKQIHIFPGTVHGTELFDTTYASDFRALLVNFLDGLPPVLDSTPAGTTRIRSTDDVVMVYVPAGEFQMGSDADEAIYAQDLCKEYYGDLWPATCWPGTFEVDEMPAHSVTLDSFWIDQTEVTNGQYRRCVQAGDCDPPVENGSHTRDSYYDDSAYDDYPVIWVRWDQAADYCAWAGGRLPTEAEWEYAARGPEGLAFPWGNAFDGTLVNYCDVGCSGVSDETVDDGYPDTAPVASFPAGVSWCGAMDMAGNVREWVADWFKYYSYDRKVNPAGPSEGDSRIPRGGSWYDTPNNVRSAHRGEATPDYTRHKVGFRCASFVFL